MLYYERKLKKKGWEIIIGVDEAGRGPLAGPVLAAAVALKTFHFKSHIDDSKKLTPLARQKALLEIINKSVSGIGIVSEVVIDRINILEASRLAMERSIASLVDKISAFNYNYKKKIHIIVDGNMDITCPFIHTKIIKGDSKSKSIACASILAKEARDRIMNLYDRLYPQYGFKKHKGYPTKEHRAALEKFGPCLIHRKSFYGV
ncbi:MAG: ribonuclease HII [Candidatus Omnitrophota bacterium]|nr:ribonuclease HII [Candidatus Omnitrophota bacterium]